MKKLPLTGIRVADFTWIGAGSFTTKLLADFGAEVIKIESIERLDPLRGSRPYKDGIPGINRSGYFSDRNSSKQSIRLNLKHSKGQALARRLIETSDVVANNFTPGIMEKFGLGYDDVIKFKSNIIYLSMSMQGSKGPDHDYLGFGFTIGALTGLQALSGLPDREPAGTGTNFPDHIPNPCHAAFATLAALKYRRETGCGQYIDVAQTEPTIALLGPAMLDYSANGNVIHRQGNRDSSATPHGVYPCDGDDRWIAISVMDNDAWSALVDVLGRPDSLAKNVYRTAKGRQQHWEDIDKAIGAQSRQRSAEELMQALQHRGVAAGAVRDAQDVMRSDEQLSYRKHWVPLQHPEMGEAIYNAPPFRLSNGSATIETPRVPAPLLGQHTDEVCRNIFELTDDEIAQLTAEGVLK